MSVALPASAEGRSQFAASPKRKTTLSVVIPARNSAPALRQCLAALASSSTRALEIVVVDDASTDDTAGTAESMGARVIRLPSRQGPAVARNIGADSTTAEILVFIDSDVCVHPDTLELIAADLVGDSTISAVFGSYDTYPAEVDFISRYKNLQHHFFHQTSPARVCTFWSGCGAVRRDIFLAFGGFSASYQTSSVEDIEFGMRLSRAGHTIKLNRDIQVTHLKKWSLGKVIRTDVVDRAIPWTEILLRYRQFPSVLNLEIAQRISVLLCLMSTAAFGLGSALLGLPFSTPFLCLALLALSGYLADSCAPVRSAGAYLYTIALFVLVGAAAYLSNMMLLVALVAVQYIVLVCRRVLVIDRDGKWVKSGVACGVYGTLVAVMIIRYVPTHWTSMVIASCAVGVLYLNREFYRLIASSWGRFYAVSSIPFHFLYQMSCAAGLVAGTMWFYMRRTLKMKRREPKHRGLERIPVLNIELSEPYSPLPIGDDRVSSAMIICRMHGRFVGKFEASIENGVLSEESLRRHVPTLAWYVWRQVHSPKRSPHVSLCASVVVSTHDRAEDLKRCLTSLHPLLAAGHEIIVVDNCPSGPQTYELVSQHPGVRYIVEPRKGASAARNCGVAAASHEVVAFTDDDAEVEPEWLESLLANFADPSVALVTGLTLPRELETDAQIWFERTNAFKCGVDRREFDFRTLDPLAAGVLGASVNMAVRRDVLCEVGMFDELLGPGSACKAGEDHELFCRVLARGYRAIYEPEAVVWHRHRREWEALRTQLYNYGVAVFAWWTRALVEEREFGTLRVCPGYFFQHYVRNLIQSLFRKSGCMPLELACAEIAGAIAGPTIYLRERRRLRSSRHSETQAVTTMKERKAPRGAAGSAGTTEAPAE